MKHRKLSPLQEDILKIIFKFRFATIPLLTSHRQKSVATFTQATRTLVAKQLITKKYNSAYKLAGRGAEYYLTNGGIRYLRKILEVNETALRLHYMNKNVGEPFIQKCLLIYRLYIHIKKQYTDTFVIFSSSEMAGHEDFPRPLPDFYITNDVNDYFMDIFTENLFFYVKKRVDQLIAHSEDDMWPELPYPVILLVLPDSRLEKKTKAYIEKVKDDNYLDDTDIVFLTTTIKTVLASNDTTVWSHETNKNRVSLD